MNILYLFTALLFESMAVKGEEDRKPENTHNFLSLVCFHSLEIQVIISSRSFIQNYQSKKVCFVWPTISVLTLRIIGLLLVHPLLSIML